MQGIQIRPLTGAVNLALNIATPGCVCEGSSAVSERGGGGVKRGKVGKREEREGAREK